MSDSDKPALQKGKIRQSFIASFVVTAPTIFLAVYLIWGLLSRAEFKQGDLAYGVIVAAVLTVITSPVTALCGLGAAALTMRAANRKTIPWSRARWLVQAGMAGLVIAVIMLLITGGSIGPQPNHFEVMRHAESWPFLGSWIIGAFLIPMIPTMLSYKLLERTPAATASSILT